MLVVGGTAAAECGSWCQGKAAFCGAELLYGSTEALPALSRLISINVMSYARHQESLAHFAIGYEGGRVPSPISALSSLHSDSSEREEV